MTFSLDMELKCYVMVLNVEWKGEHGNNLEGHDWPDIAICHEIKIKYCHVFRLEVEVLCAY